MSSLSFLKILNELISAWTPLFCGVAYILVLLCARRVWILRRNIAHLHAYADMVEAQLATEQRAPNEESAMETAVIQRIKALLAEARAQATREPGRVTLRGCLSLEGVGKQLAAWRLVHDADRLSTDIWPDGHVSAHAVVAKEELKAIGTSAASALSETIAKAIDSEDPDRLRPLVKEAREMIFNARDTYFEDLSDWQNKALWLVIIAAAIVVLLASTLGHTSFLLLGATGGLLARLRKSMSIKSTGFDYGVSWSILFLAPMVGALTGWAGVMVADLVAGLDLLKLPENLLATATLADGTKLVSGIEANAKLVLAVMFGFSATLFEGVMSGAEAALTKKPVGGNNKK